MNIQKPKKPKKPKTQICETFIKGSCNHPTGTTRTATTKHKKIKKGEYIKK